jgi:hypothetical protein
MNRVLTSAAALALASGSAFAFDIMSFGFTDLGTNFDAGAPAAHPIAGTVNGVFTAVSVDTVEFQTGGDFSRLVGPEGTAEFNSGFESGGSFGDVTISITVANFNGLTADGVGNVEIVDADGDVLTGSFAGTWFATGPFLFFNAIVDAAGFSTELGDGNFDGPSGGEFEYSDFASNLTGALSILLRPANGGLGFRSDFGSVSSQADAILVPAPGVLALAGMGLFAAAARRRS